MADQNVKVVLTADDKMSPGLKNAAASMQGLRAASTGAGPGFAAMSAAMATGTLAAGLITKGVTAAASAIGGAVKVAGTYEQSMNIFQAVSGATADQMAAVRTTAIALGKDLTLPATSSADAGRAMTELAKSGLSVDQAMAAAKGTLQLAAAATIDEAAAAKITGAALNAFGLEGSNATRIADMLATASNISAAEITDLGSGIQQAGFAFKATGRPVEELVGSLALLTNAGLTGSDAGTALKNSIMRLVNPTDEAKAVMKQYGIEVFDASGKLKAMPDIIDEFNRGLGDLTDEQRNAALATVLLSDGWKAFQPLLDQGGDKLRSVIEQLGRQGSAADLAGAKTKGMTGAWGNLESQAETLATTIGTKFSPALEGIATAAASGLGELNTRLEGVNLSAAFADADATKEKVSNAFYSMGTAVAEFADNGIGKVPGPAGEVERILLNVAGSVLVGLAAALRGDAKGALDAFTQGLKDLGSAGDIAGQGIAGVGLQMPNLAQTAREGAALVGDLNDTIVTSGQLWDAYGRGVANSVKGLQQIFTGDWLGASKSINEASEQFGKLPEILGGSLERSQSRWAAARQGFSAETQKLFDDMSLIVPEMSQIEIGFDSAAQAVKRSTANMVTSADLLDAEFGAAIGATFEPLPTLVEQTGAEMTTSMDTSMAAMSAAATTGGAAVSSALGTAGTEAATQFAAGIEPLDDEAAAAVGAAIAIVNASAGEAGAAGAGVGGAMADGMSGALNARAGQVAEAAGSIVRNAIVRMRAEAETASPSKKTAQIGEDMWAGLNQALAAGTIDDGIMDQIRGYADTIRDQLPYLGEIARVEREIKDIREDASVAALFRATEMIEVESELLRLKRDQASAELSLLPLRQANAAASREVQAIQRGSYADQQQLLAIENQRNQLRLQEIALQQQLVGISSNDPRGKQLREQLELLRQQDEGLRLQADKIQAVNKANSISAQAARLAMTAQLEQSEAAQQSYKDQIDVLEAMEKVFRANEAVIKNATDNEVQYRERLIAVFRSESKPLQERIQAGLALINQLQSEGAISEQLANQLRQLSADTAKSSATTAMHGSVASVVGAQNRGLGNAVGSTAGAFNNQARAVDRATDELEDYNRAAAKAGIKMKLDLRNNERINVETGTGGAPSFDYGNFSPADFGGGPMAAGGPVSAGVPYLVGEKGPELFVPKVPGRIMDNASSMRSLAGVGSTAAPQVHYWTVEGSVIGEEQFFQRLVDRFRRYDRDNAGVGF
jgi:TP901 family phage tail tape measure protein